jgi:hypothetical protein
VSEPIHDQPAPQPSTGDVWRLVIDDMEARRELGIERYGTPLQAHNGRDPLVDAYQEALDLAAYLRQAVEERDHSVVRYLTSPQWFSREDLEDFRPAEELAALEKRFGRRTGYLAIVSARGVEEWVDPQPEWPK